MIGLLFTHEMSAYNILCMRESQMCPFITNPNCNRANAAVVGCTCSPAVQVGDKAMLPASAMMCDSAEHVGFESGDPIGPILTH